MGWESLCMCVGRGGGGVGRPGDTARRDRLYDLARPGSYLVANLRQTIAFLEYQLFTEWN